MAASSQAFDTIARQQPASERKSVDVDLPSGLGVHDDFQDNDFFYLFPVELLRSINEAHQPARQFVYSHKVCSKGIWNDKRLHNRSRTPLHVHFGDASLPGSRCPTHGPVELNQHTSFELSSGNYPVGSFSPAKIDLQYIIGCIATFVARIQCVSPAQYSLASNLCANEVVA